MGERAEMRVFLLSLALITISTMVIFFGCNDSDSDINNNAGLSYTGTGTNTTPEFTCLGGGVFFDCSYTGYSNFIMYLREANTNHIVKLLVNEIGSYSGIISDNLVQGDYFIHVVSGGDWKIEVSGEVQGG